MKNKSSIKYDIMFYIICLLLSIILLILWIGIPNEYRDAKKIYERGYIDACEDFYNGRLKYDLIKNSDGTREWKKINK